jgi:hypothetical protein
LTHVDALLVDKQESANLVESLIELRHHYQQQVAECDHRCSLERATDARQRSTSRPLVQHHEYLASLQTATISQDRNHSLAEATDFSDSKTSEDRDLDESEVLEPEKETQALMG